MYQELEDKALMQLICSANHEAFSELVKRHTSRFHSLAFRSLHNASDAQDVVQSSFIKLWQNPTAWDSSKSLFTTWFYRVVVNACHDHRRSARPSIELPAALLEQTEPVSVSEQQQLEHQQLIVWRQYCVEVAINGLPAAQRDALNLVVYSGLPQKQAAQIMDISLKALESLLVRAKRSMAKTVNQLRSERQQLGQGQEKWLSTKN